jgi:hypothetical protein
VVVLEEETGELRSLGRDLVAARAEINSGVTWGVRTRTLAPPLVGRLQGVPALWLTDTTDDDLQHVAALTSLEHLTIDGAVGGLGLSLLAGSSIRSLDVGAAVDPAWVARTSRELPRLRTLRFRDARVDALALKCLGTLPELRHLALAAPLDLGGVDLVSWLAGRVETLELTTALPEGGLALLAEAPSVRRALVRLDGSGTRLDDDAVAALGRLAGLRDLTVDDLQPSTTLCAAIASLTGLEALDLRRCPVVDDDVIALARLPRVAALAFDPARLTARGGEALRALPALTRLTVRGTLPSFDLGEALAALPRLRELSARNVAFGLGPLARLPELRRLRLADQWIDADGLIVLAGAGHLERLELRNCARFSRDVLAAVVRGPLELLRLVDTRVWQAAGDQGEALDPLREARALRELHVEGTPRDGLDPLPASSLSGRALDLLAGLDRLRHVDIEAVWGVERGAIDGLEARLPRCFVSDGRIPDELLGFSVDLLGRRVRIDPGIAALDFSYGTRGEGDRAMAYARQAIGLVELRLPRDVTDAGLESLASFEEVRRLDARGCARLSVAALRSLARLPRLQALDVGGTDATDEVLAELDARGQLTELVVSGCALLGDRGLAALARCRALEHLDLAGCDRLTDRGLAALAESPALRWLDLVDCRRVTPAGVAALRAALPRCWIAYTDPATAWATRPAAEAAFRGGEVTWFDPSAGLTPAWFRWRGPSVVPAAIPTEDDTARLTLAATPTEHELVLAFDLRAAYPLDFSVRKTALVALSLDGEALADPLAHVEPAHWEPGPCLELSRGPGPGKERWSARVSLRRLVALLTGRGPGRLALVAAVADSEVVQFENSGPDLGGVLVRSEPVFLEWDGSQLRAP